MNDQLEKTLAEIGLSKNEIAVYIAVIKLGESNIGKIEQGTGLHKQLIYNAARELQDKNLISVKEIRGKRVFSAENPNALENFAKYRLEIAKKAVPTLFELANISHQAESVRVYKDIKGVHQYYIDSIGKEPEEAVVEILGVQSARYFEIFKKDERPFQLFEQTRVASSIKIHLLLFGAKDEEIKSNAERPYVEMRILKEKIATPMDIVVWHDHVGMLFYGAEPYVLDITGKDIVQGFKAYFDILWKKGERVI